MKHTQEDFKDKLAGKSCKHISCGVIRYDIEERGLILKIHRRKLSKGHKIYFIIDNPDPDLDMVQQHRSATIILIRNFFPNAHITSAGSSGWTIAEY